MLKLKFCPIIILYLLLLTSLCLAAEESITITTYYPSPYGVYNEMRAKKMGIGDNYYNSSSYPITGNTDLIVEGNVGIGTESPSSRLSFGGDIPSDVNVG